MHLTGSEPHGLSCHFGPFGNQSKVELKPLESINLCALLSSSPSPDFQLMRTQQKQYHKTTRMCLTPVVPYGDWIGAPYISTTAKVGVVVPFVRSTSEIPLQVSRTASTSQLGHIHSHTCRRLAPEYPVRPPVAYRFGPSVWRKAKRKLVVKRFYASRVVTRTS